MNGIINLKDLTELKSFKAPPALVKTTIEAVYVILMNKNPTWKECQKMMADMTFIQKISEYDASKLKPSMKEKLKAIVERPDFNIERIETVSKACAGLFRWVMEIYSTL